MKLQNLPTTILETQHGFLQSYTVTIEFFNKFNTFLEQRKIWTQEERCPSSQGHVP